MKDAAAEIARIRREARTRANKQKREANERYVSTILRSLEGAPYEVEYKFHPIRRWRFDMAWPEIMIALEIEGKGHANFNRYQGDLEKYNAAAELGWRVFRISYKQIWSHDISVLETLVSIVGPG